MRARARRRANWVGGSGRGEIISALQQNKIWFEKLAGPSWGMREWIPIITMYDSIPSFPAKGHPENDDSKIPKMEESSPKQYGYGLCKGIPTPYNFPAEIWWFGDVCLFFWIPVSVQ